MAYADTETDSRLARYGITECDCSAATADEMSTPEGRVPCGSGVDDIYYMDVDECLHFEGKHWHETCLLVELADRLFATPPSTQGRESK